VQLHLQTEDQPLVVADLGRDAPYGSGDRVGLRVAPDRLMPSQETSA
jgi:putative spermidine/putrescine transport system ATP-binding protein